MTSKVALVATALLLSTSALASQDGRLFVVEKAATKRLDQRIRLRGLVNHKTSARVEAVVFGSIKRFTVNVGDTVKKGDVLAEADTSFEQGYVNFQKQALTIEARRVGMAMFGLELARKAYDRESQLVEKGLSPPSALEKADSGVKAAYAALEQAENSQVAAKARLVEWEEKAQKANYRTPIDGRIVEMGIDPKQVVGTFKAQNNFTIARIATPGSYVVRARALESQRNRIALDDRCRIILGGKKAPVPCKIVAIPQVTVVEGQQRQSGFGQPAQQTISGFEIEAEFKLPTELPPNLEVEVLLSRPASKGVSVPLDAITAKSTGDFVDVARERADGVLEWVPKQVVVKDCGEVHAIVEGEVQAGDKVRVWL